MVVMPLKSAGDCGSADSLFVQKGEPKCQQVYCCTCELQKETCLL
jgi:hypothetical protein